MEWYNYVGLVLGILSLFFGFCGIFLYMKVKQFLRLITDDQMEGAAPIIAHQNKKVRFNLFLCFILGAIGLILLFI